MKKYTCSSKVDRYPGMAGWHFIGVDTKQSAELKEKYGKGRPGFGSIPISITIGKTTWQTSIFPDKRSGCYLLPLKAYGFKNQGQCVSFVETGKDSR